jgi:hypothetical protein
VRIGNSPFAPIFEVVEKPNDWERKIKSKSKTADTVSQDYFDFWETLLTKFPDLTQTGATPARTSNIWLPLQDDPKINLSIYVAQKRCGCFLRGPRGADSDSVFEQLALHKDALETAIGVPLERRASGHFLSTWTEIGHSQKSNWPEMMD